MRFVDAKLSDTDKEAQYEGAEGWRYRRFLTLVKELHYTHVSTLFQYFFREHPDDLIVSKRPGTSYQIEINFAVVNHLYLLFSFLKVVET